MVQGVGRLDEVEGMGNWSSKGDSCAGGLALVVVSPLVSVLTGMVTNPFPFLFFLIVLSSVPPRFSSHHPV